MRKVFLFLVTVCAVLACGSETTSEIDTSKLLGRWELQSASRDGAVTTTLDQLYFVFQEDGKMETNFPTMDGVSNYSIEGQQIQQRGGKVENDYVIESLGDTLVLSTEIRKSDFRLVLSR